MQNKLPQGWVECQLGDVFEIITGKTPPKKNPEYFNGKPGDLDKEIYITQTEDDSLTVEGLKYAPNLPKNTVLVSCIGNLGKKAILGVVGSCNQQINAIIPNGYIENKYTYFYIDKIVPWLEANASATTVKILNKGKFEQAPFLLPPQNEQRRIVEKIESEFAKIDEGLEHLENAKEQIKQYRQSVLKSAFDGKLYKTSEWKETILKEVSNKISDGSHNPPPKQQVGIPMLSGQNIKNSQIIFDDFRLISEKDFDKEYKRTPIEENDILLTIVGTIGESAVVPKNTQKFVLQRSVALIKPNDINSRFLKYYFDSPISKYYFKTQERGTAQKGIYLNTLKNLPVLLPSMIEQKRIVEEIEKRFAIADEVEKVVEDNIEKAKQLKQSILKKAFEGNLVPQEPTDEPASTLLEKIKQERSKK